MEIARTYNSAGACCKQLRRLSRNGPIEVRKAAMDYRNRFVVKPGQKIKLKEFDPDFKAHHQTHEEAARDLERYRKKLSQMQILLWAEKKHAILIVLQG